MNNDIQNSKPLKSIDNRSKSTSNTVKKDTIFLSNNKKLNQFTNLESKLNDFKSERL